MEEQIKDIQTHESKMLEQIMALGREITALTTQGQHIIETAELREHNTQHRVDAMEEHLTATINGTLGSMSDRITDVTKTVRKHDELFERLTRIQERQDTQMASMQTTLDSLVQIKEQVAAQDARLKVLESNQLSEQELRKERIKGRWALGTAAISGILAIIGILLPLLIK